MATSSITNSFTSIEKFNGQNFHTWQMKVKYHLMREGLWDFIKRASGDGAGDSSDIEPVITYTTSGKNDKAFAIIALALGDDYIHHISDLESASQAWIKLDILFGARTQSSKIALKISFFELTMKEGDSIAAHVNQLRSLMVQLSSVKSPVTEDDAIAVLLKSMPDTYDTIVTTLKYQPNPSLESIINALQEEERKKNQRVTTESAFAAKYKGVSKKPCKHCGKTNHLEKDCFKANPCSICGRDNHREKDCFSKDKNTAQTSTSTSANLVLMHPAPDYDEQWAF